MLNKTFGSFIREKRIEKGLKQRELADLLYVTESAVSKWETGKSYPDITMIPNICKVLDVTEKELIDGLVQITNGRIEMIKNKKVFMEKEI